MIQLCRHILPGGKICDQASVRGTLFCRHHSSVKAALERERAVPAPDPDHTPIALVFPEDSAAIQLNLFLVIQALNSKRIDKTTANTFIRALRVCQQNLRTGPLAEISREKVAQAVITLPSGEEIAMPRQAVEAVDMLYGPDEIHGLGCSCEECEGKADHRPKERHHAACICGVCQPAADATGDATREATVVELHSPLPEPYDWNNAPAWAKEEEERISYQKTVEQLHRQALENQQWSAHAQPQSATTQQTRPAQPAPVPQKQLQPAHTLPATTQPTLDQQAPDKQTNDKQTRDQRERDIAAMETLAAEYELRTGTEVKWKNGMKETLLDDFKQALAEDRPYHPRNLAANGA